MAQDDELRFESLKEPRGWYFVEYAPPLAANPFAFVNLVVLGDEDASKREVVAQAMEYELAHWTQRYVIPVMVSSFGPAGDLISLKGARDLNHLMGYRDVQTRALHSVWGFLTSSELPPLADEHLKTVYRDIPFRTMSDIRREAAESLKKTKAAVRLMQGMLILWLVVVPVLIALLGFASVTVGILALAYSVWRGVVQLLKLLGKWPTSTLEKQRAEEERLVKLHHWHCKKNPEGFQRLMCENNERQEREQIALEAAKLVKS